MPMQRTIKLFSGVLVVGVLAGCACAHGAKRGSSKTVTLRQELHQLSSRVGNLEVNVNDLASSQRETQNQLRALTGLQEGLRQQLEALSKQTPATSQEPDEK